MGLAQLTDDFVQRADVSDLFGKVSIQVTSDRACPLDPAFAYSDRVVIELVDGRSFDSGEIRFPLGNSQHPLDAAGLRSKFRDCIQTGIASNEKLQGIDEGLYDRIARLEDLPSLRNLFVAGA